MRRFIRYGRTWHVESRAIKLGKKSAESNGHRRSIYVYRIGSPFGAAVTVVAWSRILFTLRQHIRCSWRRHLRVIAEFEVALDEYLDGIAFTDAV